MTGRTPIDRYVLYGEPVREVELNYMHVEPIRFRSGRFGWTIAPHAHGELHQILLVTAGGGAMRIEARPVAIRPPALLVIPCGTVHAFDFAPGTDGWVASISDAMTAAASDGDPAVRELFRHAHAVAAADVAAATLLQLFESLSQELVWTAPARRLAIQAELLRLLVTAIRLVEAEGGPGESISQDALLVERLRRQIEQDFRRGEPVSAYARTLGVSEDRLLAACQRRFGEPPLAMIHRRVVLEAQRWLVYTPKPVSEIGHELGFADPAYFSRFFKRRTGETPREYRAARSGGSRRSADPPSASRLPRP